MFTQPAGLDTETMQTMTRESNLSECTFVFPPELAGTDHRVRIFTRTAETPFAGHPTIGTAFALAHAGVLKPGTARTTFGLGVGPINLDLDWKDGRLALRVDDAAEADVRQDHHRRRGARGRAWASSAASTDARAPGAGGQLRLELLHRRRCRRERRSTPR